MNPLKRIISACRTALRYHLTRERQFRRFARKRLYPAYSASAPRATNDRRQVIVMFDGRIPHGGLADRLRGIVTIYDYCREHGLDFRIHFTSPFRLEEFLLPALHDWRIDDERICYNSRDAHPVFIDTTRKLGDRDKDFQRRTTERFLNLPYRQIHVYTNAYYAEDRFGELFGELFRPSDELRETVERQTAMLEREGRRFVSVSTRFRELLGDFNEHRDRPAEGLPAAEQEALIARCCARIEELRDRHREASAVLVTSDSGRFLERASRIPGVMVLPGEIGHLEIAGSERRAAHLKTFSDFLVLSRSAELYLLVTGGMYRGNFAHRAAQLGRSPYHEIIF